MRLFGLFSTLLWLSLSLMVRPASAISISYNGSCVYGDCANPVDPFGPPDSHNFSYNTTFSNGDVYQIAGNVQDQQLGPLGYSYLGETFTLTYVGNAALSTSAGNEVVNFDVSDIFYWPYDLAAAGTQVAGARFSSGFNPNGYVQGQYSISHMPGAPFSPLSRSPSDDGVYIIETRPRHLRL